MYEPDNDQIENTHRSLLDIKRDLNNQIDRTEQRLAHLERLQKELEAQWQKLQQKSQLET